MAIPFLKYAACLKSVFEVTRPLRLSVMTSLITVAGSKGERKGGRCARSRHVMEDISHAWQGYQFSFPGATERAQGKTVRITERQKR